MIYVKVECELIASKPIPDFDYIVPAINPPLEELELLNLLNHLEGSDSQVC